MKNIFFKIDYFIEKASSFLLISSLATILFFGILGIVLRWFDTSIASVGPFVRHLVFLSTFLGGVIATGRKNHIGIDILSKYIESGDKEKLAVFLDRFINLVCVAVLIWLIYSSIIFFKVEAQYGKVEFFGIHSKFLVAIIPFGFTLIAYRFFYLFFNSLFPNQRKGLV